MQLILLLLIKYVVYEKWFIENFTDGFKKFQSSRKMNINFIHEKAT